MARRPRSSKPGKPDRLVGRVASLITSYAGRVEADGLEHLPRRGPAILAINHTTFLDVPPVLATLQRAGLYPSRPCLGLGCGIGHGHVRMLAAAEVFANPVVAPLARRAGAIEAPVAMRGKRITDPRKRYAAAGAAAIRAARSALDDGEIVAMYPEGHVNAAPDGSPGRFRPGIGRLVVDARVPVIPVVHHDARRIGDGDWVRCMVGALTSVVRRPTIRLRVGRPMLPEEFAGLPVREVVELVQRRVTEVWRTIATEVAGGVSPGLVEKPL
ncbi:MAG TPA: lysophospholipid acyltransferase family protein [Jiangellaceae bacterium]